MSEKGKRVGNRLGFPVSRRLFFCERATNPRAGRDDELLQVDGRCVTKIKRPHILDWYQPPVVDYEYLARIMSPERLNLIDQDALAALAAASERARDRFNSVGSPLLRRAGEMFPWREVDMTSGERTQPLSLHNNTAECTKKALVYKLDPVRSLEGCDMACIYCLLGRQHALDERGYPRNDTVWTVSETLIKRDYDQFVAERLESMYPDNKKAAERGKSVVLDMGVNTDFFSAAMLESGMAHKILIAIVAYFNKHPDDPMQVEVYSKAGMSEMMIPGPHEEPPVLTLLQTGELRNRAIVVGSIGAMSPEMREALEPGAPALEDRINLYHHLHQYGLLRAVLYQPLIQGVYDDEIVRSDLKTLRGVGVEQVKLQMIALDEATAATFGPIIGKFLGKWSERKFWNSIAWDTPPSDKKSGRRYPVMPELTVNELVRYKHMAESLGLYVSFCRYDIGGCAGVEIPPKLAADEAGRPASERGVSNSKVESETGYTCIAYKLKPATYEELNKASPYPVSVGVSNTAKDLNADEKEEV